MELFTIWNKDSLILNYPIAEDDITYDNIVEDCIDEAGLTPKLVLPSLNILNYIYTRELLIYSIFCRVSALNRDVVRSTNYPKGGNFG